MPEARLTAAEGSLLGLGEKSYAGTLILRAGAEGTLTVVNAVPLETYLLGVVGAEMPLSWNLEALKAQAVAARTYAVSRMLTARDRGATFDVYSDTRSQVYSGAPKPQYASKLSQVVTATTGEVLVFEGNLLTAFFHSTCGGHTESAARVFKSHNVAPLHGVPCDACTASPLHRWEVRIAAREIKERLGVAAVDTMAIRDVGPSGRGGTIVVRGGSEETLFPAKEFRKRLGTKRLKSTAFEAEPASGEFVFRGRGFGHGVGLCQWGARGLAERGKSYLDILEHYYPGALILQADALPGAR
jgi:stage II sporulation protein D